MRLPPGRRRERLPSSARSVGDRVPANSPRTTASQDLYTEAPQSAPFGVQGARARRGRSALGGARGVRELAEEPVYDERDLLADVHGVVADSLERARDERHVDRPLARVGVIADFDREAEDLAVEAVDLAVLAHEVLGERRVAPRERR